MWSSLHPATPAAVAKLAAHAAPAGRPYSRSVFAAVENILR